MHDNWKSQLGNKYMRYNNYMGFIARSRRERIVGEGKGAGCAGCEYLLVEYDCIVLSFHRRWP